MALDDDALEPARPIGNGWIFPRRDRAAIEKTSAVVKLECLRGRQASEPMIDLRGNRTLRAGFGEGVPPEVAHQATPRTFAIGQENCCHSDEFARFGSLLLETEVIRPLWVKLVPSGSLGENPGVAFRLE